jgi:hypothetical protein
MGQMTDAKIAAWQEAHGIGPATGDSAKKLRELSGLAYELIRMIELEISGIRDGDGAWHGCDPLDGTVRQISDCWQRFKDAAKQPAQTDTFLDDFLP